MRPRLRVHRKTTAPRLVRNFGTSYSALTPWCLYDLRRLASAALFSDSGPTKSMPRFAISAMLLLLM